jgi:alpha-L-rhamnosidase
MFGDVSAWFAEYLAGLRADPAAVGYHNVLIRPMPAGDLTSATATHDGPYGPIRVDWSARNGRFTLRVSVPANSTATVYVPTPDVAAVTEGAGVAGQAVGVMAKGTDGDAAVFEVGSGDYVFSAPRSADRR